MNGCQSLIAKQLYKRVLMKILYVASEVVPFSKTGGLADVAGALPLHLQQCGCDIRVAVPLYRSNTEAGF